MNTLRMPRLTVAVGLVVLATSAVSLHADVFRYRTGGPWQDVSDGATPGWGVNPDLPGTRVPGPGDEARVNWAGNTVTVDYEAPTFERLLIGVDEPGFVEVNDGGVLTASQDIVVGNNGFIEGTMDVRAGAEVNVGRILWVARGPVPLDVLGFLNIDSGGTVNVASHLWWGSTGIAEVNISGTLNQTGGILGLGSSDFSTFGGSATVNILSGGEMKLNNIHAGGDQLSIQPGSKIDISGTGRLTLPGDFVEVLEGYRDADLLHGNGVAANVTIATEPGGPPSGDFNSDGVVNAADYTLYRDNVGEPNGLPNDDGLGAVGQPHYDLWEASYGDAASLMTVVTAGLPSGSAALGVPEPGSLLLVGAAGAFLLGAAPRRRG